MKIGFLGMGVMGGPMSINVVKKCGCEVYGYDVVKSHMKGFVEAGGTAVKDPVEIYRNCDVIMQILPTHPIIINSVEQAVKYGKPGNIIIDLSSTAPHIIQELYQKVEAAGLYLLDSPVSGGNPAAIAGTLAIMTGGDREIFDRMKPYLACMGDPVYTGKTGSGSVTKLVNNMIAGAYMVAMAEGYAFAAKAGIDLQTTFEATRGGFAGGPAYDNKVPKIIHRDYVPGARIAVHRKDIINAKKLLEEYNLLKNGSYNTISDIEDHIKGLRKKLKESGRLIRNLAEDSPEHNLAEKEYREIRRQIIVAGRLIKRIETEVLYDKVSQSHDRTSDKGNSQSDHSMGKKV